MSKTRERRLFTSESVTEGHPDKLADRISDAILDAILTNDPLGRVACETVLTRGLAVVVGEITTETYVDMPKVIRQTIKDVGYTRAHYGLDHETCGVMVSIAEQSPDIAQGVNTGGAGDQGMMFGYACSQTQELMPLPIQLAHALCRRLAEIRRDRTVSYLRPDGKSQVTVEYEGEKPIRVDTIVVSAQHSEDVTQEQIKADVIKYVVGPVIPVELLDDQTKYFVNPTGRFVTGGPAGDSGLTGRKIIVDTYGGWARHGGGCFSGKDPTKVDRSAAYAARYIAKNVVSAGLADRCEVQLAYAIGVSRPVSILVDTFGTSEVEESRIAKLVERNIDLSPAGIIAHLNLRRPIYQPLAAYGHFGRHDVEAPWENTDLAATLAADAKI